MSGATPNAQRLVYAQKAALRHSSSSTWQMTTLERGTCRFPLFRETFLKNTKWLTEPGQSTVGEQAPAASRGTGSQPSLAGMHEHIMYIVGNLRAGKLRSLT